MGAPKVVQVSEKGKGRTTEPSPTAALRALVIGACESEKRGDGTQPIALLSKVSDHSHTCGS